MLPDQAYAFGPPQVCAVIRQQPEDFYVVEDLGFGADGEGEHQLVLLEKRQANTSWVAEQLASFAGIAKRDVGFAGLKDRNAITRQWFSLGMAGQPPPDWSELQLEGVTILESAKHRRKLRRGSLKGNQFVIILRELDVEPSVLVPRLTQIKQQGVPNYFGEQRFGRQGANLQRALAMFQGKRIRDRNQRSMFLSAARSAVFNALLSQRVEMGNWNQPVQGDAMVLAGSNSFFLATEVDEALQQRVATFDVHPSGCLWGRGELASRDQVAQWENDMAATYAEFCRGLEQNGLQQARRALRLLPEQMDWDINVEGRSLTLRFFLPAGAYATSVLRELVQYSDASTPK